MKARLIINEIKQGRESALGSIGVGSSKLTLAYDKFVEHWSRSVWKLAPIENVSDNLSDAMKVIAKQFGCSIKDVAYINKINFPDKFFNNYFIKIIKRHTETSKEIVKRDEREEYADDIVSTTNIQTSVSWGLSLVTINDQYFSQRGTLTLFIFKLPSKRYINEVKQNLDSPLSVIGVGKGRFLKGYDYIKNHWPDNLIKTIHTIDGKNYGNSLDKFKDELNNEIHHTAKLFNCSIDDLLIINNFDNRNLTTDPMADWMLKVRPTKPDKIIELPTIKSSAVAIYRLPDMRMVEVVTVWSTNEPFGPDPRVHSYLIIQYK